MKTTSNCQQAHCTETATDEYCAFHHLALISGPDLFSGLLESIGGLEGTALLSVVFDLLEEPLPEPTCRHDGRLGACYLTYRPEFPGLSRTPWEIRSATFSRGIPLN